MLTVKDFQKTLNKAPELLHINDYWRVWKKYEFADGEFGRYVRAPDFQSAGAFEPNVSYGGENTEELWGSLEEYFIWRFGRLWEGELASFLARFVHMKLDAMVAGAVAGTMVRDDERLHRWLDASYGDLAKESVDTLHELFDESVSEVEEIVWEYLERLYCDAIEAYREGGTERLFACLREHYKETMDRREQDRLFANINAELGTGAGIVQALSPVAFEDEDGLLAAGAVTQKIWSQKMQDKLWVMKQTWLERIEERKGMPRTFYPLSFAGLFLEFADLGAQNEITEEDVDDWVHRYGVLDLELKGLESDPKFELRGGPKETIISFAREAEEADWTRKIYEAVLRLDVEDLEEAEAILHELRKLWEWSDFYQPSIQECRERTWGALELHIQGQLDDHCVVKWRRSGSGLVEMLEPRTLLGAMYLQLAWVMRDRANVQRCRHCGKLLGVDPRPVVEKGRPRERKKGSYKNQEFCSKQCGYTHNNEKKRRKRQSANPASTNLAVRAEAGEEIKNLAAERGMDAESFIEELVQAYKTDSGR